MKKAVLMLGIGVASMVLWSLTTNDSTTCDGLFAIICAIKDGFKNLSGDTTDTQTYGEEESAQLEDIVAGLGQIATDNELYQEWQQTGNTYYVHADTVRLKDKYSFLRPDTSGQYRDVILYGIKICRRIPNYGVDVIDETYWANSVAIGNPQGLPNIAPNEWAQFKDPQVFTGFEEFPGGGIGIKCKIIKQPVDPQLEWTYKVIQYGGCLQDECLRKRCLPHWNCPLVGLDKYNVISCTPRNTNKCF